MKDFIRGLALLAALALVSGSAQATQATGTLTATVSVSITGSASISWADGSSDDVTADPITLSQNVQQAPVLFSGQDKGIKNSSATGTSVLIAVDGYTDGTHLYAFAGANGKVVDPDQTVLLAAQVGLNPAGCTGGTVKFTITATLQ